MRPADDTGGLPAAPSHSQEIAATADYVALREAIVEHAVAARERAARAINTELVLLYWSIGRAILTEQERHAWGDDVVGLLAQDLRAHDDLGRGFSRRNLFYMRKFAALWPDEQIVQPLAAQIGWTHHQVLLDAFGDAPDLYTWYAASAIENRWSHRQLRGQIDLKLRRRARRHRRPRGACSDQGPLRPRLHHRPRRGRQGARAHRPRCCTPRATRRFACGVRLASGGSAGSACSGSAP